MKTTEWKEIVARTRPVAGARIEDNGHPPDERGDRGVVLAYEIAPEHLWPSTEAFEKAKTLIGLIQAGKQDDARLLFERFVADRDHSLCEDEGPCRYEVFIALLRCEAAVLGVHLRKPWKPWTP